MLSVWSNRPQFLHLGLFVVAYVMGCGFAQVLAIVPGITVSIWPPAGVFVATLILTSTNSWPWWILAFVCVDQGLIGFSKSFVSRSGH